MSAGATFDDGFGFGHNFLLGTPESRVVRFDTAWTLDLSSNNALCDTFIDGNAEEPAISATSLQALILEFVTASMCELIG